MGLYGEREEGKFILRIPIALLCLDLPFMGTLIALYETQCFSEASNSSVQELFNTDAYQTHLNIRRY